MESDKRASKSKKSQTKPNKNESSRTDIERSDKLIGSSGIKLETFSDDEMEYPGESLKRVIDSEIPVSGDISTPKRNRTETVNLDKIKMPGNTSITCENPRPVSVIQKVELNQTPVFIVQKLQSTQPQGSPVVKLLGATDVLNSSSSEKTLMMSPSSLSRPKTSRRPFARKILPATLAFETVPNKKEKLKAKAHVKCEMDIKGQKRKKLFENTVNIAISNSTTESDINSSPITFNNDEETFTKANESDCPWPVLLVQNKSIAEKNQFTHDFSSQCLNIDSVVKSIKTEPTENLLEKLDPLDGTTVTIGNEVNCDKAKKKTQFRKNISKSVVTPVASNKNKLNSNSISSKPCSILSKQLTPLASQQTLAVKNTSSAMESYSPNMGIKIKSKQQQAKRGVVLTAHAQSTAGMKLVTIPQETITRKNNGSKNIRGSICPPSTPPAAFSRPEATFEQVNSLLIRSSQPNMLFPRFPNNAMGVRYPAPFNLQQPGASITGSPGQQFILNSTSHPNLILNKTANTGAATTSQNIVLNPPTLPQSPGVLNNSMFEQSLGGYRLGNIIIKTQNFPSGNIPESTGSTTTVSSSVFSHLVSSAQGSNQTIKGTTTVPGANQQLSGVISNLTVPVTNQQVPEAITNSPVSVGNLIQGSGLPPIIVLGPTHQNPNQGTSQIQGKSSPVVSCPQIMPLPVGISNLSMSATGSGQTTTSNLDSKKSGISQAESGRTLNSTKHNTFTSSSNQPFFLLLGSNQTEENAKASKILTSDSHSQNKNTSVSSVGNLDQGQPIADSSKITQRSEFKIQVSEPPTKCENNVPVMSTVFSSPGQQDSVRSDLMTATGSRHNNPQSSALIDPTQAMTPSVIDKEVPLKLGSEIKPIPSDIPDPHTAYDHDVLIHVKYKYRKSRNKTRSMYIHDPIWRSMIKGYIRRELNYRHLAKQLYQIPELVHELQKLFLKQIETECSVRCSSKTRTLLRKLDPPDLDNLKLEDVLTEVRKEAPLLHNVLDAVRNEKCSDQNLGIIASLLLYSRSTCLSAAHHVITKILQNGGTDTKTIDLLSSMGLCAKSSSYFGNIKRYSARNNEGYPSTLEQTQHGSDEERDMEASYDVDSSEEEFNIKSKLKEKILKKISPKKRKRMKKQSAQMQNIQSCSMSKKPKISSPCKSVTMATNRDILIIQETLSLNNEFKKLNNESNVPLMSAATDSAHNFFCDNVEIHDSFDVASDSDLNDINDLASSAQTTLYQNKKGTSNTKSDNGLSVDLSKAKPVITCNIHNELTKTDFDKPVSQEVVISTNNSSDVSKNKLVGVSDNKFTHNSSDIFKNKIVIVNEDNFTHNSSVSMVEAVSKENSKDIVLSSVESVSKDDIAICVVKDNVSQDNNEILSKETEDKSGIIPIVFSD